MEFYTRCLSGFLALLLTVAHSQAQCSGTTTVTAAPSGCSTWTGDIVIPTDATDDIRLNGLERIDGNLNISDVVQLFSVSSNSLHTVSDGFIINTVMILSELNFPQLTSVGSLEMTSVPNLQENTLLDSLTSLRELLISNSAIEELKGFGLQTIEEISISNNNYLNSIILQPYNITGTLQIDANGRNLDISMPNIESARNMTFRNASGISTPSLRSCDILGLYNNFINEFSGAPLLREVTGSLAFVDNTDLERIALPELQKVGSMLMTNNTELRSLDTMYSLETVEGAIDVSGSFENATFPALQDVRGSFFFETTADMSCDELNPYWENGVISGRYNCTTATDSAFKDPQTDSRAITDGEDSSNGNPSNENASNGSGSSGSKEANSDDSEGLSTGARVGMGIGIGGGVGAIVGGLVGLWLHRRNKRRQRSPSADEVAEKDGSEVDGANMLGNDVQKFELEQPMGEMGTGAEAQELPAKHGVVELDRSASTKGPEGIESRHEMPADTVLPHDGKRDGS